MTEGEARGFLMAWQNYLRHFSIPATQRTVDLMTAVGVTAFLYIPRAAAVVERKRRPPSPPQPGSITAGGAYRGKLRAPWRADEEAERRTWATVVVWSLMTGPRCKQNNGLRLPLIPDRLINSGIFLPWLPLLSSR